MAAAWASAGAEVSSAFRASAGEELARRLPRLIFAAVDPFPDPRMAREGPTPSGHACAPHRCVPVVAVLSLPALERLDVAAVEDVAQLAAGARRPRKEVPPRKLELDLPCEGSEVRLVVSWHDCVDFWRIVAKGGPSCTEALACADAAATLHTTPEWEALRRRIASEIATPERLLSGEAYLRACAGAAMTALRRAQPESPVSAWVSAALSHLRLRLSCACGEGLGPLPSTGAEWRSEVERLAAAAPAAARGDVPASVDSTLRAWCAELRAAEFQAFAKALPWGEEPEDPLQEWRRRLEAQGVASAAVIVPPAPADEHPGAMSELFGGLLADRSRVVFMAQVGSFMYDLHTESSDRDFRVIFLTPTDDLLGIEPPQSEFNHHVDKGFAADKRDEVEYSGEELGLFVIELAKGNPRNVELLFSSKPFVSAWPWSELRAARACFLTLRCASQYLGFVSDRLHRVAKLLEDPTHSAAEASKLLYHAQHKICDLRRILRGEAPAVALSGEERERVMALRLTPPGSSEEVARLLAQARAEKRALGEALDRARATGALHAEVDAAALTRWLRSVRARAARPETGP